MSKLIRRILPADQYDGELVRWRIVDENDNLLWRSWTYSIERMRQYPDMNELVLDHLRDKCIEFDVDCPRGREAETWGELETDV